MRQLAAGERGGYWSAPGSGRRTRDTLRWGGAKSSPANALVPELLRCGASGKLVAGTPGTGIGVHNRWVIEADRRPGIPDRRLPLPGPRRPHRLRRPA